MDREKLARVLGMLGSAHDGEILNAARLAVRLVKESGLSWSQVLEQSTDGVAIEAARVLAENEQLRASNGDLQEQLRESRAHSRRIPDHWQRPQSPAEQIEQAIVWTTVMTDWEREFITSIAKRWRLTERQQSRLDEITGKIAAIARARGLA